MRNTTVDTIDAHSPSRYCVLLCLCGGAIVSQHTAHLSVLVLGRELSEVRAIEQGVVFKVGFGSKRA